MTELKAIRIAVLAMGGEGGGVLANWLVSLGEANGYIAQLTSVPGVAQRTGATIYYIELFPAALAASRPAPVLALMPVPGDVDLVVASELMEAGRAIQRGFVTPDRTTLIASTNRVFAMTEKIEMGDGRVDDARLLEACRIAARRFIGLDLARVAETSQSMISATMFGAIAGAAALPFSRDAFERTIESGGVGVTTSKRAFSAAFEAASKPHDPASPTPIPLVVDEPKLPAALADRFSPSIAALPESARDFAIEGVRRLVDYQDAAYAALYLDRLAPVAGLERAAARRDQRLTRETARYLALAMAYEDTIRVAELKTRRDRFERVHGEIGARDGQVVEIAEYLHPRLQEVAESLPASLGRFVLHNPVARRLVAALTSSGRTVRTTSLRGFLLLYAVSAMKPYRRSTLRYSSEQDSIDAWLGETAEAARSDYDLACELVECRNLVKGYGDTLDRGRHSYMLIAEVAKRLPVSARRAEDVSRLRKAALSDESGSKLKAAIAAIQGHRDAGQPVRTAEQSFGGVRS
jgi:indolepyruvate ferredoxin oxidoreductase beta subunit